jgi:hypothetical protein
MPAPDFASRLAGFYVPSSGRSPLRDSLSCLMPAEDPDRGRQTAGIDLPRDTTTSPSVGGVVSVVVFTMAL